MRQSRKARHQLTSTANIKPANPSQQVTTILFYVIPLLVLLFLRMTLPVNICDDAYISFKTAVNLGDGNGMVFNVGEKIYLVTTPLWVLLLAVTRIFTSDVVVASQILGSIFEALLLINIVHLGKRITNSAGVGMLAAVFLCTNPVFILISISGMELALYLLVIVFSLNLLTYKKYCWALIVAAIAAFVRFDGLVLYAVILGWTLWSLRGEVKRKPIYVMMLVLPSLVIIASYFLFGYLYYGDAVPVSVQRKILGRPAIFSEKWQKGAFEMIRQFARVFVGRSGYWFLLPTPFTVLVIPFIIGWVKIVKRKEVIPLLAFTIVYVGCFVWGGKEYAKFFPWYFVPFLLAAYLIAASGCHWLSEVVSKEVRFAKQKVLIFVMAVLWVGIIFLPLKKVGDFISGIGIGREKTYAATTVWLGRHLPDKAIIAANEIGAVGFFSRPGIEVLDMFGLLRKKEDFKINFIELVKQRSPEAIITSPDFDYREVIDRDMANAYIWIRYGRLEIGLRSDLGNAFRKYFDELPRIYSLIQIKKEYSW